MVNIAKKTSLKQLNAAAGPRIRTDNNFLLLLSFWKSFFLIPVIISHCILSADYTVSKGINFHIK